MKTGLQISFLSSRVTFFGAALALAGLAPIFASACSGDDTTTTAAGGPIGIESIRKEYETANCNALVRCGAMPDLPTCLDVNGSQQELLQLLADVVYGTVTYDGAAARTCINAINAASCDAVSTTLSAVTAACEGVFKGSIPEGGGCVANQECEGTGICDRSMCMGGGPCCIGVCAPKVAEVPLGGDCSMAPCVTSAYCDNSGQGGAAPTCMARNDNGQPCPQEDACLDGQRCDTNGDHTCYKLSAEGQQCNPAIATGSCLRVDNWCESTDHKCVKLPGAGQPCAMINGEGRCLSYAYCDQGTCKSKLLLGEACMMGGGGPECLGELYCGHDDMTMADTCTRPDPAAVCVLDPK